MPTAAFSPAEDRPAGPPPPVSIVIPARNAERTLPPVLAALEPVRDTWEILVVNDHSTDGTALVASQAGARVLVSDGRRSDSAARNTGARHARGEILVFLDADVVADPGVIRRGIEFRREERAASVFAIYDRGEHLSDLVSRFKNYWIRFTTLNAPRPIRWINTSLAIMERADFERIGGLEVEYSRDRGGGDLDLGRKLAEQVGPVLVHEGIEVRHLKRFTLQGLLRNDFNRARGWFRSALYRRGFRDVASRPRHANVDVRFSLALVTATVATGLLPLVAAFPAAAWAFAALALTHLALSGRFLNAARRDRVRGWPWFPLLLWVDHLACAAGLGAELLARMLGRPHPHRERSRPPAGNLQDASTARAERDA